MWGHIFDLQNPLVGSDKYILMYDVYTKGKYQFTESSDLHTITPLENTMQIRAKRKDIARMLTELRKRELTVKK